MDEAKFFYAANIELTKNFKKDVTNWNYKILFGATLPNSYGTLRFLYQGKENRFQWIYGKKINKDYVIKIFAKWEIARAQQAFTY